MRNKHISIISYKNPKFSCAEDENVNVNIISDDFIQLLKAFHQQCSGT